MSEYLKRFELADRARKVRDELRSYGVEVRLDENGMPLAGPSSVLNRHPHLRARLRSHRDDLIAYLAMPRCEECDDPLPDGWPHSKCWMCTPSVCAVCGASLGSRRVCCERCDPEGEEPGGSAWYPVVDVPEAPPLPEEPWDDTQAERLVRDTIRVLAAEYDRLPPPRPPLPDPAPFDARIEDAFARRDMAGLRRALMACAMAVLLAVHRPALCPVCGESVRGSGDLCPGCRVLAEDLPPDPDAPAAERIRRALATRGWAVVHSAALGEDVVWVCGDGGGVALPDAVQHMVTYSVFDLVALRGADAGTLAWVHREKRRMGGGRVHRLGDRVVVVPPGTPPAPPVLPGRWLEMADAELARVLAAEGVGVRREADRLAVFGLAHVLAELRPVLYALRDRLARIAPFGPPQADGPCAACGGGLFWRPPGGGSWHCASCEPADAWPVEFVLSEAGSGVVREELPEVA